MQRDCQVCGLSKDHAMVHGRWSKLIRMVHEREGCEWMNVSSGTGSPGYTRTKGRKTVVCVYVSHRNFLSLKLISGWSAIHGHA